MCRYNRSDKPVHIVICSTLTNTLFFTLTKLQLEVMRHYVFVVLQFAATSVRLALALFP